MKRKGVRNPVAKNMNKFNKPARHRNKKQDYTRKDKHKPEWKQP